jgi:hypothetical protein
MDGEDVPELLGWLVDCAAAAIAGGAAGMCLWLLGQGFMVVSAAVAGIAAATCGALRAWGSSGRHYRLPAFELPSWVDALAEPLLLDQPVDGAKIVRLHRAVPPAISGFAARGGAIACSGRRAEGEIVPFAPDAGAALKAALAQLRRVP